MRPRQVICKPLATGDTLVKILEKLICYVVSDWLKTDKYSPGASSKKSITEASYIIPCSRDSFTGLAGTQNNKISIELLKI